MKQEANRPSSDKPQHGAGRNGRIAYIDALRGFTMFLVVFGHVLYFSFDTKAYTIAASFFATFRMPMFFFVSGFIGYKAVERWTTKFYLTSLKKKLIVQTLPALFFFTLYQLCTGRNPLSFVHYGFGGYWFTFVLLEMFIVYFSLSLLARYTRAVVLDITLVLVAIAFQLLTVTIFQDNKAWSMLSPHYLTFYFLFFAAGILVRRHFSMVSRVIDNSHVRGVIIVAFIACFYVIHCHASCIAPQLWHLFRLTTKTLAMLMVFNFFRSKRHSFDHDTIVTRSMVFVGRRTLDIYLLHFFFLPDLSHYGTLLLPSDMVLFQIIIPGIIALAIIGICLVCSEVIRSSNVLAHYILGAKRE